MNVVRCMGSMTRAVGMLGSVDEAQNGRTRWGHGCGSGRNGEGDITLSRGKFELDSGVASPIGPSVECHLPTYFIELRTAKTEELKL